MSRARILTGLTSGLAGTSVARHAHDNRSCKVRDQGLHRASITQPPLADPSWPSYAGSVRRLPNVTNAGPGT